MAPGAPGILHGVYMTAGVSIHVWHGRPELGWLYEQRVP